MNPEEGKGGTKSRLTNSSGHPLQKLKDRGDRARRENILDVNKKFRLREAVGLI